MSGLCIIYSLCIHVSYQHDLKNDKRDREVHEYCMDVHTKSSKTHKLDAIVN